MAISEEELNKKLAELLAAKPKAKVSNEPPADRAKKALEDAYAGKDANAEAYNNSIGMKGGPNPKLPGEPDGEATAPKPSNIPNPSKIPKPRPT